MKKKTKNQKTIDLIGLFFPFVFCNVDKKFRTMIHLDSAKKNTKYKWDFKINLFKNQNIRKNRQLFI